MLNKTEGKCISPRSSEVAQRAAEQLGYRPNFAAHNLARRKLPAAHRAEVLFRTADITRRADELAELESRDNGMTAMGAGQIIKVSVEMLIYYADGVGRSTANQAISCATVFSATTRTITPSPSSRRSASLA